MNLLHENHPQLTLAREGMEQGGINSSSVGCGRAGLEESSKHTKFPRVSSPGCCCGSRWKGCPCTVWQRCHIHGRASWRLCRPGKGGSDFFPVFSTVLAQSLCLVHPVGLPGEAQNGSSTPEWLLRWDQSLGADGHEAAFPSTARPGRVEMAA